MIWPLTLVANETWSWAPTETRVNPIAVWAVVLAVVAPPLALIFSVVALRRIQSSGERGQELAIAALMISSALVVGALLVALTYVIR